MEINLGIIIASTINFFIFYFILKKFVFNKTLVIINKRKIEVEEAFKKARDEEERAEQIKKEHEVNIKRYKEEGLRLVESFKNKADKVYLETVEEATKEAALVRERAIVDAEREKQKAEKEIKTEIINLSLKFAEKALEKEINEEEHKRLIDDFITKVGS
ncbi:F0F1 ATP synthase subunit B [Clostridium sp.]|uniref:F0F1 ATP synthase subunit B n=1 Tax=Clostridium sp. TaxID=1506 RepID=UPI002FC74D54